MKYNYIIHYLNENDSVVEGGIMKRVNRVSSGIILCIFTIFPTLFLFNVEQTFGSSVLKVDFDQVVQGSELIFEGRILSKEVRVSPINGFPFTYFKIQVIDIIKGSCPDPIMEIGFMGGELGDMTLEVSDMRMPIVDERGIYFVETLKEQQINPLYGWQQGYYLIKTDEITRQNFVIPIDQGPVKNRAKTLRREVTFEVFRQNIRNILGGANEK